MNANLDVVVSAVELLEALEMNSTTPCDHPNLSSAAELEQVVGFSMLHCAGVERTFVHRYLFDGIVNTASTIPHSVSEKFDSLDCATISVSFLVPYWWKCRSNCSKNKINSSCSRGK